MITNKFNPLSVSTKFHGCGLPVNLDSYNGCDFGCRYCFSFNKIIGKRQVYKPDINRLRNKFRKIYDDKDVIEDNFLEKLLENRITLHGGAKSDCFQRREMNYHYTRELVDVCNEYEQKILFSTKSDSYYDVPVNPEYHSFHLSVTNHYDDKFVEPNVPSFEDRVKFYDRLKDEGFKVGIRIHPYLPNITDLDEILSRFRDVDHVTIATIHFMSQKIDDEFISYMNLTRDDFINRGIYGLTSEYKHQLFSELCGYLDECGYSYNVSDRDMRKFGTDKCCCGESLCENYINFTTTSMIHKYGLNWRLSDALNEIGDYKDCNCWKLFTSNRKGDCRTIEDFWKSRFDDKQSPISPEFQYNVENLDKWF